MVAPMRLGFGEILIVLVVVLLIFGANKIPQLGDALGKGIKNFRKATGGGDDSIDVTPGATSVLYDGMTADGSRVFFTTADSLDDRPDEVALACLPVARAVEVHHVDAGGPRPEESGGHLGGAVGVDHLRREVPLGEADRLPPDEVDGRDDEHRPSQARGASRTKRSSIARPTFWLFSGWNWTASRLSTASAAQYGRPCTATSRVPGASAGAA